jgi:hypothetical protein
VINYQIQIIQHGGLIGEGYGAGNSGMEAFENGYAQGYVILPVGEPVTIVAVSESGLAISFEVCRTM